MQGTPTMIAKDNNSLEVLTLKLGGHVFALEATHVREILDLVPTTEVPTASPFVSSLINVRGQVVPLADLRHKFGMDLRPSTIDTRIVVIEISIDGIMTTVGLLADKVFEVTELAPTALENTPKIGMVWRPEYIRCIGKCGDDFIVVLDIRTIFSAPSAAKPDHCSENGRAAA
jgi:purine-binding chemotaxis protein CheW